MYSDHDISELTARILELENKVDYLLKQLNLQYVRQSSSFDPRVVEAIRGGNLLDAIKVYREIYGVDPVSARTAIDEIRSSLSI